MLIENMHVRATINSQAEYLNNVMCEIIEICKQCINKHMTTYNDTE